MTPDIDELVVQQTGNLPHLGSLIAGGRTLACALGRSGLTGDKREGDGATPVGHFPLRRVLYRPDRLAPPPTSLPIVAIAPADGWCDSPSDPGYNRQVRLPYPASAEGLWRADHLYDIVVVLGHNDDPVVPGRGSAIFFHLAASDYAPTAGCIALASRDMFDVLVLCGRATRLVVESNEGRPRSIHN
jgi:L,D-peptidoglycan transpeptidase YkuD (ErfK/YbiS/YcfS/YnhG family)